MASVVTWTTTAFDGKTNTCHKKFTWKRYNENITNARRAKGGECQKNEEYMEIYCRKSCLLCSGMYPQLTDVTHIPV